MESPTPADRWSRVQAVFDESVRRTGEERRSFLDDACASDPELRREVESLLAAHDRATDFLEAPVFEAVPQLLTSFSDESLEGRTIGAYIVRQEIGRGGMGVVYLADDTRLSRRVALKAFAPELGDAGRERLWREARAAAVLSHPGIATVYALEEIDGRLYMICEYVPGQTLRAVLQSGPLPAAHVLDIAIQLARALSAAHAQGIVHRDLKPENVVRTTAGVIKVLDFGIARSEHLLSKPDAGSAAGTPGYMAPEQASGAPADFRSDLFAFGVLVSELATGIHPSATDGMRITSTGFFEHVREPIGKLFPSGFERLQSILEICLQQDPSRRYESTFRLVADLEQLQRDLAPRPGPRPGNREPARQATGADQRLSTTSWWEFHQIVVSLLYAAIVYPAWIARQWLAPAGSMFVLTLLTCATAGVTLRLHLVFVRHFHDSSQLHAELRRTRGWIRWADTGLAIVLLMGAVGIAEAHSTMAMLFVTVAIAAALASFVIEPATTRAAFDSRIG